MSDVDIWLGQHAAVCDAIKWADEHGVHPYLTWSTGRKAALASAVGAALGGGGIALVDPPPNVLTHGDDDLAATALSANDAWHLYLAYLAQSLAVEMQRTVPWSLDELPPDQLADLLDGRRMFDRAHDHYRLDIWEHRAVPAPPRVAYDFLAGAGLIGSGRVETIGRLLDWCRGLSHFIPREGGPRELKGRDAKNMEMIWQYRGVPPVSRILAGTVAQGQESKGVRHWTAGCWGTTGFLQAMLRVVNIPCRLTRAVGDSHALPHFPSDDAYVTHGDDPYNQVWKAMPDVDGTQLLVNGATYQSWFGAAASDAEKLDNVGRQPWEVGIGELWRSTWSAGWTSFVPLELGGVAHSLAYKVGDGEVSVDRVRAGGQGTEQVWGARWSTGWTSFMPFVLDGRQHYLAYKAGTGRVAIDRLLPDGRGTETRWDGSWSTGWTSFVPVDLGGVPHYLAYKVATGEVNIDRVLPGGTGAITVAGTRFTPGWTHFVPLTIGHRLYLAYRAANGELNIDQVARDGASVTTQSAANVGPGWTSVMPFLVGDDDQHVLFYNAVSGDVAIFHIRPTPPEVGPRVPYRGRWTGGWTTLMRFSLAGRPRYLAYKAEVGTVTISRLCG